MYADQNLQAEMNHSTETFSRIEAIFNEALAAPRDERTALIDARCNHDAALMAEVRSLLKSCAEEELATAARRAEGGSNSSHLPAQTRIGPYEIDRLLGRGGMGAVYLAHRADGQFEQQVAIKLIDLPLASGFFRERFRQERQILAGLQHPLIARLLDGGITSNGDLYLAMEYVDGTPIHRFCDEQHFTVSQRLAVFKSVCDAVQFAHQNLVVHRDLKPDNILIAHDGTPRLLDFGTAKLLSPSVDAGRSDFTRQGYQSFTPQYASPEQVLGNPVTTASDTYSLGVLLYLLLTGAFPYELKEFTTAEMVRVICHEPPRRPASAIGSNQRLDPDLEAIVLKALRKEPRERYLTAEQLAADVQAHLDGRPVSARRGTLQYRARKFARRNRLALAAAGLLAITLSAGIAGVLWQARVANIERRKAEARSADLRQLSTSLLSELDEAIKQLPGSTGAQKLLVTRVLEHLDRMAKDAKGDRLGQLDLIDAYTRLGNIQGNGYEQNLGNRPDALASIDKAIAIGDGLVASSPRDQEALRALANAQASRGEILSATTDLAGAVASLQTAAQTYDRLIALPGAKPEMFTEASTVSSTLGDVLGQDTGFADLAAAITAYRKSLDLDTRALAIDPNFMRARRGLATMQMHIGNAELDIDPAQALADFQLALQRLDALPESDQNNLLTVRLRGITIRKVAAALSELGEYSQATPLFEQAVEIHQRLVDADPKDIRNLADLKRALEDEASSYEYAADPALASPPSDLQNDRAQNARRQNLLAAEHTLQRARATIEQMLKMAPGDAARQAELADFQVRIGVIRELLHEPGDALSLTKSGLAVLRSAVGNDAGKDKDKDKDKVSPMILDLVVASFLRAEPPSLRDPQFAAACAERGVTLTHRKTPAWLLSLAEADRSVGQIEKARAVSTEGLALLPATKPGAPKSRILKLLEIESRN
jgi:eukaryotic-like serine/threonine-protein kinase